MSESEQRVAVPVLASPAGQSEYWCFCSRWAPLPSLPLTEGGRGCSGATSTFVAFYCCGQEAIAVEGVQSGLCQTQTGEKPGFADGEDRKSGSPGDGARGSKSQGPAHHPHLTPSVCPPSRSVCFLCPLAGLLLLMDQRAGASPGCQLRVHSGVSGGELCSCLSSGGQMKSQLDLTAGMKARISSTDLHLTALAPGAAHRAQLTRRLPSFSFCSAASVSLHWFAGGALRSGGGGGMWPGGKVCLKPTCVFLDEVECCGRGGAKRRVWLERSPPNVGLADSIKKISKGPL